MKDRKQSLIAIRPTIDTIVKSLNTKELEGFQNDILRPILKFQNDLLLHLFMDYAKQYKGVFFKLARQEQMDYIQQALITNQRFKSKVIGTVIGLFTIDDYSYYSLNLSALNKRIITMTIKRLQDQIHLLNNGLSVKVSR
jgi:hypothetical protein